MSCLCAGLYSLLGPLRACSQPQVSILKWTYRVIHITSHPNLGMEGGEVTIPDTHFAPAPPSMAMSNPCLTPALSNHQQAGITHRANW